jgi:cytidylate kinase
MTSLVIAIDGPSGVGKSTAARRLAETLSLPLMDTGAMYRALALDVLRQGIDPGDQKGVVALSALSEIDLRRGPEGRFEVLLAGRPVEGLIRTPEVSEVSSRISTYVEVRQRMVQLQQLFGARDGAVVEGRDIGTVVFPDTPHKFFIDASAEVRAERRYHELRSKGETVTLAGVRLEQDRRDLRDSSRAASPLTRDESYCHIDTSELSIEDTVQRMLATIRA